MQMCVPARVKTSHCGLFGGARFPLPKADYALSEVTRDLHGGGIRGVMADYEEKFHSLGTPINRCVATKLHREPALPEENATPEEMPLL